MAEKRGDVGNVGEGKLGGGGGDRMAGGGACPWVSTGAGGRGCSDSSSSDSDPALGDFTGDVGRGGGAAEGALAGRAWYWYLGY